MWVIYSFFLLMVVGPSHPFANVRHKGSWATRAPPTSPVLSEDTGAVNILRSWLSILGFKWSPSIHFTFWQRSVSWAGGPGFRWNFLAPTFWPVSPHNMIRLIPLEERRKLKSTTTIFENVLLRNKTKISSNILK